MSAHKIMDSDGNLTDRETPLRYLKIGDQVTHTEERPNEIATVVRSAGDHIVIQWAEGLSYAALPKYLRTVTDGGNHGFKAGDTVRHIHYKSIQGIVKDSPHADLVRVQWQGEDRETDLLPAWLVNTSHVANYDTKPTTYALDDVMEAFGITREELKTETTQGEAMTTKGGLLKADFFPSGDLTTAAGNVVSIMQNNEAVALCLPVTVEQPDSIAFMREDVPRVIEELQRALDTENVLIPIYRPKDQP